MTHEMIVRELVRKNEDIFIRCFKSPTLGVALLQVLKNEKIINPVLGWNHKSMRLSAIFHLLYKRGHFIESVTYPGLEKIAKEIFSISAKVNSIKKTENVRKEMKFLTRVGFVFPED
jgi:hypothetical protein